MLSVTTLSSYLYCPRKLYLEKVLGLTEPPKEALIKGSIRHKTYEEINLAEECLVTSITAQTTLEDLKGKYHQKYKEILLDIIRQNKDSLKKFSILPQDLFKNVWPLILAESESRASLIHSFIQKHNIFGEELWQKLTPKIESELRIESKALGLKGIIDQIEIYENGFVPIELKTGKCPNEGVWPGHRVQLVSYALLLEEKFKTQVKEGFVHYLDSKQKRHIAINPFMRMEILDLIKEVSEMLSKDTIPVWQKSQNKCSCCGLKERCYNENLLQTIAKSSNTPRK